MRTGDDGQRWEVTTIAGDGQCRVVDAQGTAASTASPSGIVCINGWLYVVEPSTVRCVSPTGHVTAATLNNPRCTPPTLPGSRARLAVYRRAVCIHLLCVHVLANALALTLVRRGLCAPSGCTSR